MSKLQEFINLLEQEVNNHSIYVWGAQGQTGPQISESWIRKCENSVRNANRAVSYWKKQVSAGYGSVLKAFDCSGLGVWALQKCGIINYDTSADGFKSMCTRIEKSQLRSGCFVFQVESGIAKHVGYVVNNNLDLVESQGRDAGVVKRNINQSSKWNWFGTPPFFADELGTVNGPTSMSGSGAYSSELSNAIMSATERANVYCITLDRNSKYPKFDDMKKLGVIGTLIEAGQFYNPQHREYDKYVNPNIEIQTAWCSNNDLPFGLYTVCRAKTRIEAQKELRPLIQLVQLYPPLLGVWITLELTSTVSINDKILEVYKETFENYGLKNKIGLYTTKQSLSKVTWSTHMNDWYLWLISHVKSDSDMTGTYMPEFFELGE